MQEVKRTIFAVSANIGYVSAVDKAIKSRHFISDISVEKTKGVSMKKKSHLQEKKFFASNIMEPRKVENMKNTRIL